MRIVAGAYRGRPLTPPESKATRPTIDRVREALFSSLYSLRGDLEGAVVLDAFAGSGALGLEALSRGARKAVFCDCDRAAQQAIRANIESLGAADAAELRCVNVLEKIPVLPGSSYDLVLLDPPYKMPVADVMAFLELLRSKGALASDAIVSYEHAATEVEAAAALAQQAGFEVIAQKKYGKTRITLLREKP